MIELTQEQETVIQQAVNWYYRESSQTFEIAGLAGTGKSVILMEIVRRLKLQPYQYLAAAYTGAAAIVMRMKGFPTARSLHATFYHYVKRVKQDIEFKTPFMNTKFNIPQEEYVFLPLNYGDIPKNIKLIIIDEGFMVPMSMIRDIKKHGIKILVAGDPNQLPPVSGNPAFLTGPNVHYLTQIMRQNVNNPILYLADRVLNNLPIHCGVYGDSVLVIEDKDLTNEMVLNVGNIVCGTNRTRDSFNYTIRQLLGRQSEAPEYSDRIICRENDWDKENDGIALANGLQGYIVSPITPDRFFDGRYQNKSNKGMVGTFKMDFLPDLLKFPFRELDVNYEYIVSDYARRRQIKDNIYTKGELFEYAYAITTHLSQGSEYQAGIFYEEFLRPEVQRALIYTGITRFKQSMIYVKKTKKYY